MTFDAGALKGRVALVTGAAGGLGLSICEQLEAMGAQVVRADISCPPEGQETATGLHVRCDLARPGDIADLGHLVRSRYGRCDVLVNNAAISGEPVGLESLSVEVWDRVLGINLRAALLCAQAVVPMMFEQQAGSIINVASIGAQVPTRMGAYGTSKAGLLGLTRQMAVEWGPRGLRANAISPGMIRTPLSEVHYQDPEKLQTRTARIPTRRIGQPPDIAGTVGFLASDASGYVNGQDLVVDGGFLKASLANLY